MINFLIFLFAFVSFNAHTNENERPYVTLEEAFLYCNYAQKPVIKIGSRFDFNQDGIVNMDDVIGINRVLLKLREPSLGINCSGVSKLLERVNNSLSYCEVAYAGVLAPPYVPGENIIFNQVFTNGVVGRGSDQDLFENPGKGFIDFDELKFTPYPIIDPGVEINFSYWNIEALRYSKGSFLISSKYYKTVPIMSVPTSNIQLLSQNPFVFSDRLTKKCSPASDPGHRVNALCEVAGSNGMVISNSNWGHRLTSTSYGTATWCE